MSRRQNFENKAFFEIKVKENRRVDTEINKGKGVQGGRRRVIKVKENTRVDGD